MKKIHYHIIAFLSVLALLQGCETTDLDKQNDPNILAPDQADPSLLFNTIQLNYRNSITTFNNLGGQLSRIDFMFGRVYRENFPPSTLNGPWSNLYSGIMPDLAVIESLNTDGSLDFLEGASKAMQAHVMMLLVDYMGDITWSEAGNPAEFPSPTLDDGASVYQAALGLLTEAKGLLTTDNSLVLDMYFDGSAANWVKFINTLEMRAALTTGNYQAVINATNVIETSADNMYFEYGTNELQPDTRHPDYIGDYSASGAGNYRSNWLMDLMIGTSGDNTGDDDPRRRYYFYRQSEFTPGKNIPLNVGGDLTTYTYPESLGGSNEDAQTLVCSTQNIPVHLEFTAAEDYWCGVRLGYWGRIHGNAEGIPPDGFQRTASGVYPAGGRFDGNPDYVLYENGEPVLWGAGVGVGLGAGGNGIEPMILSSFVEFWRAEAYLKEGNTALATAHFTAGIEESIAFVTPFGSRDGSADLSLAPDAVKIQTFTDNMTTAFDGAALSTALDGDGFPVAKDKMDILGEQFFVAMYGAGADAYNFIRRTGYPRTLARSIESNPGTFPRSLFVPDNETSSNINVSQKQSLDEQVFWDSGVTNPAN